MTGSPFGLYVLYVRSSYVLDDDTESEKEGHVTREVRLSRVFIRFLSALSFIGCEAV